MRGFVKGGLVGGALGGLILAAVATVGGIAMGLTIDKASRSVWLLFFRAQASPIAGAAIGMLVAVLLAQALRALRPHREQIEITAQKQKGMVLLGVAAGVLLGLFWFREGSLAHDPEVYSDFPAQAGVMSRIYWTHAAAIRYAASAVMGGSIGVVIGALCALVTVKTESALSAFFWLVWVGCAGFCAGGIACIIFAWIIGTLTMQSTVEEYVMAYIGAGIPGSWTLVTTFFWCSFLPRSRVQGLAIHIGVGLATSAVLCSFLILETTSRVMKLFEEANASGQSFSRYAGQFVVEYVEGKLMYSRHHEIYGGFPHEPILAVILLPIAIGITVTFISYFARRAELPETKAAE